MQKIGGYLATERSLPSDGCAGTLIGRAWITGQSAGPAVVALRADGVYDLTAAAPTVSELLNAEDPVGLARSVGGARIGDAAALLANSAHDARDTGLPWFLAPCDLQPVKACGVTFVSSLLERVIEEQAHGDPARAETVRQQVLDAIGGDLATLVPGSGAAMRLKHVLIERGAWSQYLEVGIGPDAEVFTKAPPMASVGLGAEIGVDPHSTWNNPEPEIVLAVNSSGHIVGASLGNDVNLRDVEGRSALLLGKAKDNNASCAIGPFIRLFDETFRLDDVRQADVSLSVEGEDGFELSATSSMAKISRDPLDLVGQAMGRHHQYPDGMMLFTGTMFAPVQDRDKPGHGFTHHLGDVVRISSPLLGSLVNRVNHCDRIEPWVYGTGALMRNLAARGLL